jgi:hypothetical protein
MNVAFFNTNAEFYLQSLHKLLGQLPDNLLISQIIDPCWNSAQHRYNKHSNERVGQTTEHMHVSQTFV